ncbi:hypothetical protein [Alcaligenes aquatilis]|uniref:Coiled-coil protein n=1 Tax=Alcaligenes aquatilis TaxID=323284 RepID=A0A3G2HQU4_9BURK|nr:hypothetical protein [Alcaligenes aquatilis]AYN19434.1 hypothetical protein D3M96_02115 [Alcaligenes aquatilis]
MNNSVTSPAIYFTDFFNVDEQSLENYGALNISLINDLPLFIDPFLLFDSEDATHKALHEDIINYVKYLRDISVRSELTKAQSESLFKFSEVRQNWLGYSQTGNRGSGLGNDFAVALHKNLRSILKDFGSETLTRGSHLEKVCLLGSGVGKDHLSDFTTNLIKHYLLDYTQEFAQNYLSPHQRRIVAVDRVNFDYKSERWKGARYELPYVNNDYVILTPKSILTKDESWINRSELLNKFEDIYNSVSDEILRSQVNDYFLRRLSEDATKEEEREAAASTLERFPQLLDHYIRLKEENASEAHKFSKDKVLETERQFITQVQELVVRYLAGSSFYSQGNSFQEALKRISYLKDVIENQDGYRFFYVKGEPIKREADLQLMYRLTWYADSGFDVNREVNNGRGPVDYKISRGSSDKTLVEFKLASNSKLKQNLKHQVGVYEAANNTSSSIKVILYFSDSELIRTQDILNELGLLGSPDIVLIDASSTNKPSASNVKD